MKISEKDFDILKERVSALETEVQELKKSNDPEMRKKAFIIACQQDHGESKLARDKS